MNKFDKDKPTKSVQNTSVNSETDLKEHLNYVKDWFNNPTTRDKMIKLYGNKKKANTTLSNIQNKLNTVSVIPEDEIEREMFLKSPVNDTPYTKEDIEKVKRHYKGVSGAYLKDKHQVVVFPKTIKKYNDFLGDGIVSIPRTSVHEFTHSTHFDESSELQNYIKSYTKSGEVDQFNNGQEHELYPELMGMRKFLNKKPEDKFKLEDLELIKSKHKGLKLGNLIKSFEDNKFIEMMNGLVSNKQKSSVLYAKKGAKLSSLSKFKIN
jgi:hypothetical protein